MCGQVPSRVKLDTWPSCWSEPEGEGVGGTHRLFWAPGRTLGSSIMQVDYELHPHTGKVCSHQFY